MVYIGAIVSRQPPGREECADGKFTTSENPGRCSRHGGVALPNCMKAKRRPTKEAQFRRDAAAAPKVIVIPSANKSQNLPAPAASLPPSLKPVTKQEKEAPGTESAFPPGHPLHDVEKDIPYRLAYDAHRGTSFSPEVRAKQEIEGHISYMTQLYNELSAGRTPEQLRILDAEFLVFRKRYSERRRAILHRRTGIMSMMITGGSNFPTRQQNKRKDADHKAYGEFIAWEEKALARIRKNGDIYPEKKSKQPIRSGSSTAIQQLTEKLQKLESSQERMKLANQIIRSGKDVTARLMAEVGLSEAQAIELQKPDFAGRTGFADYQLTNNNAEIRRTRQRLEAEKQNQEARAEGGEKRIDFNGGYILENIEENRLQIFFDSIPPVGLRDKLKSRGFRWAPSNQAWQRQLTKDARQAAIAILEISLPKAVSAPTASLPPSMKQNIVPASLPARIPPGGALGFEEWAKAFQPEKYARWERLNLSQGTGLKQAHSVGRQLRDGYEKYLNRIQKQNTSRATGIDLIPIQAISIRRDWFQNRATPYSERSVENIVQAAKSGAFRWSQLDPVTLWAGPDGKLYMLSGHSRLEAFDRLCRAGAVVDGRNFCEIPAKIEANIGLEEARRIALESNTLSTKETELERAEYYRAMRMQGKDADKDAKRLEGDNWSTIIALSYLNPSGKTYTALQALERADATSKGNIRTIARWIGNARAKYGLLTNFHEDELYTWLVDNLGYGTRQGQISNERDFNNRLASIINRRSTFGRLEDSLNIAANVTLSPVEAQYNQQLSEASETVKALQKQLDEKIREYRSRNATENQILELTAPISAQLTRARIEYQNLLQKKGDIVQYAKQEVNLFANLSGHRPRRKHLTA